MTTQAAPVSIELEDTRARLRTDVRPPVIRWAWVGGAFLAFFAYLLVRWVASGNATPNRVGSDDAPGWMHAAVWVHIVLGGVAIVASGWWFLVRPWRDGRRVTSDGLFMLACLTCFWGDLASNYFRYWVIYPTVWPNLGSWYNFIPGWQSPNGEMQAEATIFFLPMYAACMFAFTSVGMTVMRKVQERWSSVTKVQLFLVAWLTMALIDLVLEVVWVRLGLFVYPSTIRSLTLFPGETYQFPIYESVFWGLGWTVLTAMRYFKNDRGETVVERGANRVQGSERKRLAYRFLALAAVANLNLLGYNVITAAISTQADAWPDSFTEHEYYTHGLCSEDAAYACPGGVAPDEEGAP